MMAQSAVDLQFNPVIIPEDFDVFVLLTALTPTEREINFCNPSRSKVLQKLYSSNNISEKFFKQLVENMSYFCMSLQAPI